MSILAPWLDSGPSPAWPDELRVGLGSALLPVVSCRDSPRAAPTAHGALRVGPARNSPTLGAHAGRPEAHNSSDPPGHAGSGEERGSTALAVERRRSTRTAPAVERRGAQIRAGVERARMLTTDPNREGVARSQRRRSRRVETPRGSREEGSI
jgi:hypothetical protein